MKYLKAYEKILIKIGDSILTDSDLEKYKDKIEKHYGSYSEENITNALWTLYTIEHYYNKGGTLYRVIWLKDENDFDINNLGYHWVEDLEDAKDIIFLFKFNENNSLS